LTSGRFNLTSFAKCQRKSKICFSHIFTDNGKGPVDGVLNSIDC